jgi:hypothetical protein
VVVVDPSRRQDIVWPPRAAAGFAAKYPLFMRAALCVAWAMGVLVIVVIIGAVIQEPGVYGQDSHAYWLAAQGELAYSRPAGTLDAYLYSPAFLLLTKPLTWLPWPAFLVVWTGLLLAVAAWLVKPLPWRWAVPLFTYCLVEVLVNNIFLLLALAAALGVRWSAAWAFPILTKVTMGVGLLWFAARGDWRHLAQGLGATAVIVAVCYVIDPAAWRAWVEFLFTHRDGTKDGLLSFALRCIAAVTLVMIGARRKWPWLIAPAMVLASPVLINIVPAVVLVAIPRLATARGGAQTPAEPLAVRETADVPC